MERTMFLILFGMVALASSKPIMVTFGTNQGPIIPREKLPAPPQPRNLAPSNPAPVSEQAEDIPNPSTYRPLVPHQYRTKLYSYKPPANLVLGTAVDQRYTPGIDNYNNNQQFSSIGVGYTGPHIFEKQAYEFEAKKVKLQPSVRYEKPQNYQQQQQQQNYHQKYVPQIGIVYSAGVKYYVPQFVYYNQAPRQELQEQDRENSVYDKDDRKYQGRQY